MAIKKIPLILRKATFTPGTFHNENRTIDVVFSTGAQVERGGFFSEPFIEELSLKKDHVRLGRLNNGAPFLNNHRSHSFDDQLGVVEKAKTNGKEGTATVRFSKRAEVQPIVDEIRDGIIRNISVGYRVYKFEEQKDRVGDLKVFRAVDWEPMEISAVMAGADDGAKFRGIDDTQENECEIVYYETRNDEPSGELGTDPKAIEATKSVVERNQNIQGDEMTEEQKRKLAEDQAKVEKENENAVRDAKIEATKEAQKDERKRQTEIRSLSKACKIGDAECDKWLNDGVTVDDARKLAIEKMTASEQPTDTRAHSDAYFEGNDEGQSMRDGIENALLHRHDPTTYALEAHGKQYRYMTLLEQAKVLLRSEGVKVAEMSRLDIAKRAVGHTSSDFPKLLENIATKTMQKSFGEAPQTFAPVVRRVTVPDFKQVSRTQIGDAPLSTDDEVLEKGEITRGSLSEAGEKYQIKTYAKIVCFSRQMLINDDMDAFSRIPALFGRAARDLESDLVWLKVINANAAMADGFNLFSSDHNNLGSAGALSETTLSEARQDMRKQVGLDGRLMNLVPVWLFVSPENETAGEKLISSISPNASGDVNPFGPTGRTSLSLVVEPRLSAVSPPHPYYLSAATGQVDMIELATLDGTNGGPVIESREGFDIEGLEIKVRHDVHAAVVEFRGLYKNVGA